LAGITGPDAGMAEKSRQDQQLSGDLTALRAPIPAYGAEFSAPARDLVV